MLIIQTANEPTDSERTDRRRTNRQTANELTDGERTDRRRTNQQTANEPDKRQAKTNHTQKTITSKRKKDMLAYPKITKVMQAVTS